MIGELQDKAAVTKAPRLKKADGAIDWSRSATEIFNQVRALKPWPGTYTNLLRAGKPPMRVIVRELIKHDAVVEGELGNAKGFDEGIAVRCGEGSVLLTRIQPAGKREMESAEFVRGYGATLQFGNE